MVPSEGQLSVQNPKCMRYVVRRGKYRAHIQHLPKRAQEDRLQSVHPSSLPYMKLFRPCFPDGIRFVLRVPPTVSPQSTHRTHYRCQYGLHCGRRRRKNRIIIRIYDMCCDDRWVIPELGFFRNARTATVLPNPVGQGNEPRISERLVIIFISALQCIYEITRCVCHLEQLGYPAQISLLSGTYPYVEKYIQSVRIRPFAGRLY